MDAHHPPTSGYAPFQSYNTAYWVFRALPAPPAYTAARWPGRDAPVPALPALGDARHPYGALRPSRCGLPTRLPDKDAGFWTIPLFLAELDPVRPAAPPNRGVRPATCSGTAGAGSSLRSTRGCTGSSSRTRPFLPLCYGPSAAGCNCMRWAPDDEREGTLHAPEYPQVVAQSSDKHLCTLPPWPEELTRALRTCWTPTVPIIALCTLAQWPIPAPIRASVPACQWRTSGPAPGAHAQAPYLDRREIARVRERVGAAVCRACGRGRGRRKVGWLWAGG
ncbi:hypothetical protein CALCODRAFT_480214 [Calocera cornea HHB12733]|uniref:Uncharacterized protein n=1 Tax=Calocera cornea HHB12733 TaxID=1353952 RepID=A0A165IVV7_9BASI|nr:hypothetical protein CALCODRAFT_480214 [Calocera cornea HHB12733]